MTALAALALGLIAFVVTLKAMRAEEVGRGILTTARSATATMSAKGLSDDEKERLTREAAVQMFGSFFRILGITIVSLGLSALIIWAGSAMGLYTLKKALTLASSLPFLIGSTVAAVALWIIMSRASPKDSPYSAMDRALHSLAFATPGLQKALARTETTRYADRIDMATAARPVFITSLARAGTTILLDVLAKQPEFASATYRHMPFALAPLLWSDMTRKGRQEGAMVERAHGDGLQVGYDSPEAFEEMAWLAFWKNHYGKDRIRAWSPMEKNAAFEAFFPAYRAKVVATKPGASRYLSKNNANILRLGLLERLAPDATILIPLRDPEAHAASLLRQHLRFSERHAADPFTQRYMEGIGHFEFGEALRPLTFDGARPEGDPDTPAFWLQYWCQIHEGILAHAGPRAILSDHDALSADPTRYLPALANALDLQDPEKLLLQAPRFKAPKPASLPDVSTSLLHRAREVHVALKARCLVP
ncbi:sulfotransferase [Falsirhodobacter sp. alg1]|uniref:sulfotransferase n=1 Tax=Falsirhodobacter sp. alg1 TaxID=1472418 RepID=UPI000786BC67|nr:sulfotransferase [Falsirhodobacter sp. alg1]